jgi:DNA modification methylase
VEAARLLKPTGFLLVYVGGMYKNQIMGWMDNCLDYWWDFVAFNTGDAPIIWPRQVISRYKSILAYRPRGGTGKPCTNVISAWRGSDQDKRYHIWQQDESTARYYVDCFSAAGDIVLDPFCGGGTTPVVSAILKRRHLSFEIDTKQTDVARSRLQDMVQPAFWSVPELKQMELAL